MRNVTEECTCHFGTGRFVDLPAWSGPRHGKTDGILSTSHCTSFLLIISLHKREILCKTKYMEFTANVIAHCMYLV